jgi:hypothetical protein
VVAFGALLLSAQAGWVAFDDHTRGPGTGTNVTLYSLRALGGGPLVDQATGAWLGAGLQVSSAGNPAAVRYGAAPATNTPAWQIFNGYVDFDTTNSLDNGSLLYANLNQSTSLTFTNLDPGRQYSFRGTSIRGGIDDGTELNNFHRRWTLCFLVGAASFTNAHSTGCVTQASLPASKLAPGQAAFNSGMNQTGGEVIGWDEIAPGPGGTFSVVQTQYEGPIWNGDTAAVINAPGYALNGFRLEETSAEPVFGLSSPANDAVFVQPAQIALTAVASGLRSAITNLIFYANGLALGGGSALPGTFTWSNPAAGAYRLSAVAWDSDGHALTSAVVQVSIRASTTPVPGKIYVVMGSDTAIWNDGSTVDVYSRHPYYPLDFFTDPSSPSFQVMDPVWRDGFTDSLGRPVRFTWWLMGGNIYRDATNLNVPIPNTLVPYVMLKYHGDAIRFLGDEVSLHYHTFLWSDYVGAGQFYWNQAETFALCRDDFDYTLAQYLLEEGIFPISFRSGWHYMDNDWQQYLDQLLPFSMDNNWPAAKAWYTNQPINNVQDWSRASSAFVPFHPATNDYQVPGTSHGWNVRSIKMQSIAQRDIDSIFSYATNGVDQVVCIWNHLPENFITNFVRVDSYLHTAAASHPAITFYYCTAVEAMQRWLGVTNQAAPEINLAEQVQEDLVTLTIQTSAPLFQPRPFVALRDASGQYSNVTALCVAGPDTNSWSLALPVPRSQLAKVGVAVTDPYGNLATRILRYLPDDLYLDNLDSQYSETAGAWLSTPEAAWGTDARVVRLGSNTAQARWKVPVARSGLYRFAAQVPAIPNPASNICFQVFSGGSNVSSLCLTAPLPPSQWVDLGSAWLDTSQANWLNMTVRGTNQPGTWAVADVLKVTSLADARSVTETSLRGAETPNGFVVSFFGTPGLKVQFERSFDLAHWTTVEIMDVPAQGRVDYSETNRPGMAAFYRVQTR